MAAPRSHRIVVTGLGMVSSVGHDVVTSCASARAGLTRLRVLDGPLLRDPDTGELTSANGHLVSGITDGFWKLGRLVRLGAAALQNLRAYSKVEAWANTGLFVNLPSGFYQREHERAARAAAEQPQEQGPEPPYEADLRTDFYRTRLTAPLLELAGLPIPPERQHLAFGDQAGFVPLLRTAVEGLQAGRYERCVVGGIDAYVESDCVEALDTFALLKTPEGAVGLMPGEGAAFVLLEREETAQRRKGAVEVVLEAPEVGGESFHRFSGEPAAGGALSRAVAGTLWALEDEGRYTGLLVGSLNGDPYRAYDWGCALVRLRVDYPWIDLPTWLPALAFGEIGAATGAAAICMVARGFARGYAGTANVLVWLTSDDGARGSFYLRKHVN